MSTTNGVNWAQQLCEVVTWHQWGLPRLNLMTRVESSFHGINNQMSLTRVSLQVGEHRLSYDLKRDGLRQVYTCLVYYSGRKLVRYSAAQWLSHRTDDDDDDNDFSLISVAFYNNYSHCNSRAISKQCCMCLTPDHARIYLALNVTSEKLGASTGWLNRWPPDHQRQFCIS